MKLSILTGLSAVGAAGQASTRSQSNRTGHVNLGLSIGEPKHLASGIIYGEPDTPNQIPDVFYTNAALAYFRAGGAQLGAPSRGWIWNEFEGRFQSTLSNYRTARKYNGRFQLLVHDIWGTDQANSSTVWPGDNGDWTNYDEYLDTLIASINGNFMHEGLEIDIWNEPDGQVFWSRPQQQWIDLFIRTFRRFRSDMKVSKLPLVGPSLASAPSSENTWWTNWFPQVVGNNTIPDQYTWHEEGGGDIQYDIPSLEALRHTYGAPTRQININEYGKYDEQVPSATTWWISRFERYNVFGLRGNWLSGGQLHDFLASLVWRDNSSVPYHPNGEWQVYSYYNVNMTGKRLSTAGSLDGVLDLYATNSHGTIKILCGTRLQTGTWYIQVDNMSAAGLPVNGAVNISLWGFNDNGPEGKLLAPTYRDTRLHNYTENTLSFPVFQTSEDANTAWAFEFSTRACA